MGVTGGAGFIGSNLTRRLISEGHEVVVFDDLSTGLISNVDQSNCTFINASITDPKALQTGLKDCQTIFHLAARGSVPRSIKNPVATHDVNATGTLNVLEVARSSGAHVIFSSSSSVYGRNMQLPKDESMWLGPMTPYAASKLAAEGYVQAYASAYKVPTTLLRFFNVFGPRQDIHRKSPPLMNYIVRQVKQKEPITLYSSGNHPRDYIHVDDVVKLIDICLEKKPNDTFNVCTGTLISVNEIVNYICQIFNSKN